MIVKEKKQWSIISIIIIIGIVSLIVGIASGWISSLITEKRAKLTYDITAKEVFSGLSQNIGIFVIRIHNEGKREIETVLCKLVFSKATITEHKVSGIPESSRKMIVSKSELEINIPFLNPGEQVSIQILLNPKSNEFSLPSIDLRGKGIVGLESEKNVNNKDSFYRILSVIIAALATLITVVAFSRISLRKRFEMMATFNTEKYHTDDQRDITAFVLDLKGLSDEAKRVRNTVRELSYWSIVDALVADWLKENDTGKLDKAIEALEYLIDYAAIAESSRQLIQLNISRLAHAIGKEDVASKNLSDAIKNYNPVIEKRISAITDLSKLYSEVKSNNAD